MKNYIAGAAAIILVTGCATKALMEPLHVYCRGDIAAPSKIIIAGESWANRGTMAKGAAKYLNRAGKSARICSVGLSGMNTAEQVHHLETVLTPMFLGRILGGKPTDAVIVTGVNDVTQHVGPSRYASDVNSLIGLFDKETKVAVTELATMDANPAAHGLSYIKRTVQRYWHDGGSLNPVARYRSALEASHPRATIIDYDSFAKPIAETPETYTKDHIHLVPAELERFGGHVASKL